MISLRMMTCSGCAEPLELTHSLTTCSTRATLRSRAARWGSSSTGDSGSASRDRRMAADKGTGPEMLSRTTDLKVGS